MAPRKLPSADHVGVSMLEQLLRHSGKQRVGELEPQPAETPEEESKSGELNIDDLEALLGAEPPADEEAKPCPDCGGKGCPSCTVEK